MGEGLVGEFAKEKINEVIALLNEENNLSNQKKKYCEQIISIIGEPILKNTLQSMYEKKIYSKESKLDKLKRKQKELENEIKELESTSND